MESMQDRLVAKLIHQNRLLFSEINPFVPEPCLESNNLKRKMKASSGYEVEEAKKTLVVPKKDGTLLLTDGDGASNQQRSEGRLINAPQTTGSGDNARPAASSSSALVNRQQAKVPTPQWHAGWELSAVISGHLGWVRSIAFDPSNEWFVTGSVDRTIKVWDLAKCCAGAEGGLKLTLTGHIHSIRGLAVSSRHPYLFSAGEDKLVKCWDLEYNKVIRHYHGHLSGVFCLELHPVLDILFTGGRDSVTRVWDMRTKHQIHVLGGHTNAVSSILVNGADPQVITGSFDSTVKLYDLAAGKAMATLTQHKKAVRSLAANPREFTFISGAADNVKKWQCRDGKFLRNFSGHNTPMNAVAVNEDGVAVSCGDNGSLHFWDYDTGYCFQKSSTIVQPGSLDAECGIYAAKFDHSGSRLVTCEADKTIKIWKENPVSTEETDPVDMKTWSKECLALKRY
ncbi:WD40-repeat-containing domain protein [Ochromonadaceae sp. CCMP2298]|nr:WD40-repeat-containing domain protein [Ochromonadaceae sp. CCMP2298]|mmetsp:Transcript_21126/g.46920  ORF Transcript_21126/g.46920 Transcript_21126/m.46920 type:complete len:453 (-) Transcript_21126:77-1435(-)|eukprot:CAMPEP_0173194280 /NCGR_PEP_ID=MMETSP1141-20130122/14426_1 /TAXON_ID=483371 /ORGANISM="non described non described, Strain CCMP2298" /LENGTH=452 /DNA_ID=CAMNT_0014118709 /DNA_START=183 /DNA_END=1541 /DNA_ORIENTATION=-